MAASAVARAAPTRFVHRPAPLHAERANINLSLRQTWLSGLVVLVATGLLLYLGIEAWHKMGQASGGLMIPLADNPAIQAIYGLPTAIDTIGGFAVWRVEVFLMLIGSLLVVLATTRVLRGNEESGRLDLVLANPLSLSRATGTSLVAIFAIPVLTALIVGAVLQGSGADAAGSWLYGLGIGLLLATFIGIAAFASQILPERSRATGIALGVLFATFVLRMFADGGDNVGWARWLSPFGWVENLKAFGGNDLLPLIPLVAAPVLFVTLAMVLAARRDTGAGLVRSAETSKASARLLTSPLAFSTRRRLSELIIWGVGMVVLGILSGGLAQSLVGFPQSQPEATQILQQAGMGAAVTPAGFIALMDVFYAVVFAGYAIACVHVDYADEMANRLDLPYSNRVSRTGWAGATVLTTIGALVALTVVLALTTWAGAAATGAGLSAGESFAGAANVLPIGILFLGVAMLLHGVQPRWTVGVAGVLVIGLFMIQLVGPMMKWPSWVLDLSPFHQVGMVPADAAFWPAIAVILGIAVVLGAVGLLGYARRDLQ